MATTTRRITATTNTIPAYVALTGTVSTSTSDAHVLLYTGTDNWDALFNLPSSPATLSPNPFSTSANSQSTQDRQSKIWIYVPAATVKIARVIGINKTSATTWSLQLDRAISGINNAPCNSINANLLSYSWVNDGGADGTVNGITVSDGEGESELQLSPSGSRVGFKEPVLVNATSTDFLIQETS